MTTPKLCVMTATTLPEHLSRNARVITQLARGVGWPRGGWLLAGISDVVRRQLVAEGYDVMEDREGRVIVEPPPTAVVGCRVSTR